MMRNQYLKTKLMVFWVIMLFLASVSTPNAQTLNLSKPIKEEPVKVLDDSIKVYTIVDSMPQFPGGDLELLKFITTNIRYPSQALENGIQGKVVVRFVVNEKGKVEKAEIVRSLDASCDREALRVIKLLPDFIPGKQNGKNVSVLYALPLTFRQEGTSSTHKEKEEWAPNDATIVVYNGKRMPAIFDLSKIDMTKVETIALIKPESKLSKQKLILQYGKGSENGVIVINDKDYKFSPDTLKSIIKIDDTNYVFVKLDNGPKFPGGEKLAMEFIKRKLVYPITARLRKIQGKVEIQFTIDKSGKVRNPRVVGNVDPILGEAALDVIYKFPDWIPAEQNGIKVNSIYTLPFEFILKTASNPIDSIDDKVYSVVEQMPKYPGGDSELLKFISQNIKYPLKAQQNRIQGTVVVRFVISKTGQIDRVEVIRSLDPDCDQEAIRVIKLLPNFIPGKQKGENVAVWYNMPITFRLQ